MRWFLYVMLAFLALPVVALTSAHAQVITCSRDSHGRPFNCRPIYGPRHAPRHHHGIDPRQMLRVIGRQMVPYLRQPAYWQSSRSVRSMHVRGVGPEYCGSRTVASSVPSPEQIARRVEHSITRACVPCDAGYRQNPDTCDCTRTTWHPNAPAEIAETSYRD
jgi:hypothetical protein